MRPLAVPQSRTYAPLAVPQARTCEVLLLYFVSFYLFRPAPITMTFCVLCPPPRSARSYSNKHACPNLMSCQMILCCAFDDFLSASSLPCQCLPRGRHWGPRRALGLPIRPSSRVSCLTRWRTTLLGPMQEQEQESEQLPTLIRALERAALATAPSDTCSRTRPLPACSLGLCT